MPALTNQQQTKPLIIATFLSACLVTMVKTENPLLRLLSAMLFTLIIGFLAGASTEKHRKLANTEKAFNDMLADTLSRGWKGTYFTKGLASGMFSPFPAALNAASAYVIAKQGEQHYILINLQKRAEGLVADIPCGFSNNGCHPNT